MFLEEWISGHADVETTHAHIDTKQKEMSMIVMTNTVVEPC